MVKVKYMYNDARTTCQIHAPYPIQAKLYSFEPRFSANAVASVSLLTWIGKLPSMQSEQTWETQERHSPTPVLRALSARNPSGFGQTPGRSLPAGNDKADLSLNVADGEGPEVNNNRADECAKSLAPANLDAAGPLAKPGLINSHLLFRKWIVELETRNVSYKRQMTSLNVEPGFL
jgi:hypothetical protein